MSGGQIATLLTAAAARHGNAPALRTADGRVIGFAELESLAGRIAGGLADRGIRRGDRVLLYLPNGWQWIACYYAIARLGAVVIPANILLTEPEIAFIAEHADAAAIILSPGTRAPAGRRAIIIGDAETGELAELLAARWLPPVTVQPADLLAIGYTSGTTGKPKGAMLTHGAIHDSAASTATIHVRTGQDRVYSALPLPHVYGNIVLHASIMTGACLHSIARFDAGEALAAIGREGITLFEGVPTMYYQMIGHAGLDDADLSSLTRCTVGGQTMPTAKLDQIARRFGCPILELWGMTEVAGPAISHSPYWPPRHGSIGLPFPGVEARIATEDGGTDAPGTIGELQVRGPLTMDGYWRDEAATRATIDADGWLATGDVATIDADGYVTIVDRKKDMILTAGYNVYPAELEQVIATLPAVAMVAVSGLADAEKGEIACAFIVPAAGAAIDPEEIIAHCRSQLAAYKVPRRVEIVETLPKTSTGKIMRRALREGVQG